MGGELRVMVRVWVKVRVRVEVRVAAMVRVSKLGGELLHQRQIKLIVCLVL